MNFFKKAILIIVLLILLIYVSNITNIPDSILLFKGENFNVKTALGIKINENTDKKIIQTSADIDTENFVEKKTLSVSFLNIFNIKEIEINEIPQAEVVPLGNIVGLRLYASGVLVIGKTEIKGEKPYKTSTIKEGDLITAVNSKKVETTTDLITSVNDSKGNSIEITYVREGIIYTTTIEPVKTDKDEYKIGLWVRDGAIGVGTISYYEPSTKYFAALGHPIIDTDTGEIVSIKEGELVNASVISIKKGEGGNPGEIKGSLKSDEKIGQISTNTEFGIYGTLDNLSSLNIDKENKIKVALREEIKTGDAKVLLTLEDGIRKEYDVKIKKIYKNNDKDNKSMLIEIVDEDLKNLTGGIIQGMSGAPLIQNGKFIGAITHVLVNNPELGYAVFGDLMIKQMRCQW
ncbi:MAG: SpoIVB peptidase [Clostridia bacterium]